jgi:hypothetical protein
MVHYKVHPSLCEGLPDGHHAFCGVGITTPGEEFHLLGAVEGVPPYWQRWAVNCPMCIKMYDAVINDFMSPRSP